MVQENEEFIRREVERRVGRITRQHNDEIVHLQDVIRQCQDDLVKQHSMLLRYTGEPLAFGTILSLDNKPNPACFAPDDEVIVVDRQSEHYHKGGHVISGLQGGPVVENGQVLVKLNDETQASFSIGLEGEAQIRLTKKSDGTTAVVSIDGKPWEVKGVPDTDLAVGDSVKIKADNKQIVAKGQYFHAGPICRVVAITNVGVEIQDKGQLRLVLNPRGLDLEEGDRVALDSSSCVIAEKLAKDSSNRYKLKHDFNVSWESIGGLELAKKKLQDALILPYQQPELFAYYGVEPSRGALIYGPPGNGKSLIARVAAWAMAKLHGQEAQQTGFLYIKAPEILDKWIGNTEAEIRSVFEQLRRHFRKYGYKGILAIDEFDAIAPQRGTRRSSDIADTMVPMFLGEMDGIDETQTRENPFVLLMTNRPDVLDPAITRPGRISLHIKVERPDEMTAIDILKIHTDKIPFEDESNRMPILAVTCSDLFSKNRVLYRVNNEHDFTVADTVSGALIKAIAEQAKLNALDRDMAANTQTGVTLEDFRAAVKEVSQEAAGANHSYDLFDFAERKGLQFKDMQYERCFGGA